MSKRTYTKEWITQVRGGLNKTEFGRRVYVYKKNGTKCVTVHRNTITNWEGGKTELPKDVETFLSFALIEYDQTHPEAPVTLEERNNRYIYARTVMWDMLGVDLYCRNLHDALLIQVCRGILTFEEVLPLERELEAELENTGMTVDEKNLYAIERNTIPISDALNKVADLEGLREVITVIHKNSFASANRIIGARFSKIYHSRKRYKEGDVSLGKAVTNLAPNYRDSYIRMFKSSNISRKWMIDLCRHLKFSRDEIARVLEAAHMVPLSEDEVFPDANAAFLEKDLLERLMILFLMGAMIRDQTGPEECPPADYILESFSLYEQGQRVVVRLAELLEEESTQELDWQEIWEMLTSVTEAWIAYLKLENSELTIDEALQHFCKNERKEYFYPDHKIGREIKNREEVQLLHFFAALMYTVLSGHVYPGSLTNRDLDDIKRGFHYGEEDCSIIYRFISQVLGTFLGGKELRQTPDHSYYVQNEVKKTLTHPLNFDVILEDLWESVLMLLPYKSAQTEVDCSD